MNHEQYCVWLILKYLMKFFGYDTYKFIRQDGLRDCVLNVHLDRYEQVFGVRCDRALVDAELLTAWERLVAYVNERDGY